MSEISSESHAIISIELFELSKIHEARKKEKNEKERGKKEQLRARHHPEVLRQTVHCQEAAGLIRHCHLPPQKL